MSTQEMILGLTTPKKKKSKKQLKGHQVPIRVLLKGKTIKKAKKKGNREIYEANLAANFPAFEKEMQKVYGGNNSKSKIFDDRSDIVDLLTNKTFSKSLINVIKDFQENDGIVPEVTYSVISDMAVSDKALVQDEKLTKAYMKLFSKHYKKEVKKLSSKLSVSKPVALTLLVYSTSYKGLKFKIKLKKVLAFLSTLYAIEGLSEKNVKLAIEKCFGKKQLKFVLGVILNESSRSSEKSESFSIVTNAALSLINKMDKDQRKELLKEYAKRRRNNPKAPKRLALLKINEDDYRNIHKTLDKLVSTGFNKELFL